ncbi:LysR family transcriptional regulator [Acidisoma cellulosilytica]|uniref:LysR family transcriptional regulator n=2 Tax=Acidisoma cellulosilyticum TaxID=2802395 RepID=A0A964E522_9PROT|nr:LysR family transcriptional regulator [Acidisoma cellulosilyticum]
MDRIDRMRLFIRVVERGSFTAAAADIGLPRSTATEAIKDLEAHLGVRLLERTTRHVAPTLDGQSYYQRCLALLLDLDEAENSFRDARPRGLLRVDANSQLTRSFLLPHLPAFMARYPLIDLHLGQGDRLIDLVREGVDCVIRAGDPTDSSMIIRRLGLIEEVTVASPSYIAAHGMPKTPDELADHHRMVGFVSSRTGETLPLEFMHNGVLRTMRLTSRVTVGNLDTMAELARLGFGLVQAPRYRFAPDLASGALLQVLPDFPPTPTLLSALYPQNRQLAPRLRVFLDWIVGIFETAAF